LWVIISRYIDTPLHLLGVQQYRVEPVGVGLAEHLDWRPYKFEVACARGARIEFFDEALFGHLHKGQGQYQGQDKIHRHCSYQSLSFSE
jgi:hypothetical protein